MIMKTRRIASALLVLTLLLSLAACGGKPEATPSPEPIATFTVPPTEKPKKDYSYAYKKYEPETEVMTINGLSVSWSDYFYWMYDELQKIERNYGEIEDFSAPLPGIAASEAEVITVAEYIKSRAEEQLVIYLAMESGTTAEGTVLDEIDEQHLEEIWQEDIVRFGAGDAIGMENYMRSVFLTQDMYDRLNRIALLYIECFADLYGERGSEFSDEDAMAAAERFGYMQAKHILIKTVDDSMFPLDEETIAERRATAEDLAAQLEAAEDKAALFEELKAEYDEDAAGQAPYPDGYCFTPGTMVPEFETALLEVQPGEITGIVETAYGFHIIMRMPISPESVVTNAGEGNVYTLRYETAAATYEEKITGWIDNAEIEYTPDFEGLDLTRVFMVV